MKFLKLWILTSLWAVYLGIVLGTYGIHLNDEVWWIIMVPTVGLNIIGTDMANSIKDKNRRE